MPGEAHPSLLAANAVFSSFSVPASVANISVSPSDHARIVKAFNAGMDVFLEPAPAKPFAGFWSSRPIQPDEFNEVGHALFTLLFSWAGGAVGRRMYATRAL